MSSDVNKELTARKDWQLKKVLAIFCFVIIGSSKQYSVSLIGRTLPQRRNFGSSPKHCTNRESCEFWRKPSFRKKGQLKRTIIMTRDVATRKTLKPRSHCVSVAHNRENTFPWQRKLQKTFLNRSVFSLLW